ncbi:DNA topoisomerase IV subunit A [Brackiella oedipodis]|uniref:DNA topoisomerase IV subunit A n=1 Tax=Brackiella oedipodis TaxID=124225 RepID=UPI00048CE67D|nr:DNA topoisomerase IV subunit A [Brackiella oedipodis]
MDNMDQTDLFAKESGQDLITLGYYAEKAYLDYAVSVVKGRALPDVCDGQKPVQRRILFAMHQMNLKAGAKPVKSARVVGDVLGRFHPHGDQPAYDAMVRMAQQFTLRYPLIDGQGNFGSRDGDGAAAMRYTEARLTAYANLLLDELNEGTVDFMPNYDGTEQEPKMLPARLPMMLLNGASGIAVGMATEVVSHNLHEVAQACMALLKQPELSTADLMHYIPGPDFVNGAQIISERSEIEQIYAKGKGSLKVRARWVFEELARNQWQLVVTELPPNTSSQKILEEIEDITNPKLKAGKKSLSQEQQHAKASMLSMLDTVRDESGKEAAVRLVFEPKSSRINRQEFVNQLLAKTSLEGNVAINLVCIGIDGKPAQRCLKDILAQWLRFRTSTVTRRTQFRLDKVLDRIHVLEGRMLVYLNVDEVIQTIRESDDPKAALMQRFTLSERQAEDILEMRLRQLARLEGFKIEQELEDKKQQRAELEHLLGDANALRRLISKELKADADKYGDERRTLIETAAKASIEVKIPDEPVTVVVSSKGWLRSRQGHGHSAEQFNFKSGDALYATFECRSTDNLIAIGDNGQVYTVAVANLPSARGDGQPITALAEIQAGTSIVHMLVGADQDRWLLAQSNGVGFMTCVADMSSRLKAGKSFINLEADLLRPVALHADDDKLALLSEKQRLLLIDCSEIKYLKGGGKGTKLMNVESQDPLAQIQAFGPAGLAISGEYRKKIMTEILKASDLQDYMGSRGRKGKSFKHKIKAPQLSRPAEPVAE